MSPATTVGLAQYAQAARRNECPVCGAQHRTEHDIPPYATVDCCLWHDFDNTQRIHIARARHDGATWMDAINGAAR